VSNGNQTYIGRATLGTASPAPNSMTFDAYDATKFDACNVAATNCPTMPITQDTSGPIPQNFILPVKVIRYQIAAADTTSSPPDNMLCLWRSETGGLNLATGAAVAPGPGNPAIWRLVSRGIINMKVGYLPVSNGLPSPSPTPNNPPVMPTPATYLNMVRTVVVTLTGRTEMQLQAGRPVSPWQGDLTSVTTPRAVLVNLSQNPLIIPSPNQWH
jgi:hypothetical protein